MCNVHCALCSVHSSQFTHTCTHTRIRKHEAQVPIYQPIKFFIILNITTITQSHLSNEQIQSNRIFIIQT